MCHCWRAEVGGTVQWAMHDVASFALFGEVPTVDFVTCGNSQVVLPRPTVHHPPALPPPRYDAAPSLPHLGVRLSPLLPLLPLLPLPLLPRVCLFPSLHSAFGGVFFFSSSFFLFPLTMSLSRYMGPPPLLANARAGCPPFFTRARRTLLLLTNARRMPVRFFFFFFFSFSFADCLTLPFPPPSRPLRRVTHRHALPVMSRPRHASPVVSHPRHVSPIASHPCHASPVTSRPRHAHPVVSRFRHTSHVATVMLPCCIAFVSPCCIAFASSRHSSYRVPPPPPSYSGMSPHRAALRATLGLDLGGIGGDRVRVRG